jgi:hypothetical protein
MIARARHREDPASASPDRGVNEIGRAEDVRRNMSRTVA